MQEHDLVSGSCALRWLVSTASPWCCQPRGWIEGCGRVPTGPLGEAHTVFTRLGEVFCRFETCRKL